MRAMVFQALQQHVVEAGRADHFADGDAGETVEQICRRHRRGVAAQKISVIRKARDQALDMIGKLGVMAADMGQVRYAG